MTSIRPILFAAMLVTGSADCGQCAGPEDGTPCARPKGDRGSRMRALRPCSGDQGRGDSADRMTVDRGPLAWEGVLRMVGRAPLGDLEVTQAPIATEGTILALGAGRLTIRTGTSGGRMEYSYTRTTTHVDERGMPVPVGALSRGLPVTVHHTRIGGTLVASKVVVRKGTLPPEPAAEGSPQAALPGSLRLLQ